MLGGFAGSNSVSLNDISNYTSDAPILLKERCADAFNNVLDLKTAAQRGYSTMVRHLIDITAPGYKVIKPAFNAAITENHQEVVWVFCEYLATSNFSASINIARTKGDRRIENALQAYQKKKDAAIEEFLKGDSKELKHRVFTIPLSGQRVHIPDHPRNYNESALTNPFRERRLRIPDHLGKHKERVHDRYGYYGGSDRLETRPSFPEVRDGGNHLFYTENHRLDNFDEHYAERLASSLELPPLQNSNRQSIPPLSNREEIGE